MPNTSSAKKALRNATKKKEFNLAKKQKIKNALKELRRVLSTNPSEYQATLSKSFSALDKAVKTNLLKKNTADRKKSRLAKLVDKVLKGEK
jgi:small subunit ribosomal protein S20